MTVYSWRGLPLLVTNPNGWTPTGVPGPNDLGEIAVGIALMVNDAANPTFQLGATPPATAPTLYMIGHNVATVDVNESAGEPIFEAPLNANINAAGSNTISAQVGSGPFDPGCSLTIRSVGNLTGTFNTPRQQASHHRPRHGRRHLQHQRRLHPRRPRTAHQRHRQRWRLLSR